MMMQVAAKDKVNLLTAATGVIDVYRIHVYGQLSWLIPKNLVLSVLNHSGKSESIYWNEQDLKVMDLCTPDQTQSIILIIEGVDTHPRCALRVDQMPESIRIRISSLKDDQEASLEPFTFQIVWLDGEQCQIPDFNKIYQHLAEC